MWVCMYGTAWRFRWGGDAYGEMEDGRWFDGSTYDMGNGNGRHVRWEIARWMGDSSLDGRKAGRGHHQSLGMEIEIGRGRRDVENGKRLDQAHSRAKGGICAG